MPITNTAAFAQYRRMYNAAVTTANGGTLVAPTNTALLTVAGPDGSIVTKVAAVPKATVTATQLQLYLSKDGGTTFSLIGGALMAAATIGVSSALSPTSIVQIDGSTMSEINPLSLSGVSTLGSTTPTAGGVSSGSANAQTLPFATSVTALTPGLVVDFEAGYTNTTSMTLTVGTSSAASVVRDSTGAAVSAGDITTGFRYRVRCDGTYWRLCMTDRLYVATGITLASGISFTAEQADF